MHLNCKLGKLIQDVQMCTMCPDKQELTISNTEQRNDTPPPHTKKSYFALPFLYLCIMTSKY